MFGRVRMYNIGFAIFSVASIFLTITWMHGTAGAIWLIVWRVVQGIGGAFLFANSTAILTDAFPANQRGTALGMNSIAAIAGSFLGLLLGGVLAPINWHFVFLVSAPIGAFGTIWAYFMLRDIGERRPARMDWWGNILFAAGPDTARSNGQSSAMAEPARSSPADPAPRGRPEGGPAAQAGSEAPGDQAS